MEICNNYERLELFLRDPRSAVRPEADQFVVQKVRLDH